MAQMIASKQAMDGKPITRVKIKKKSIAASKISDSEDEIEHLIQKIKAQDLIN